MFERSAPLPEQFSIPKPLIRCIVVYRHSRSGPSCTSQCNPIGIPTARQSIVDSVYFPGFRDCDPERLVGEELEALVPRWDLQSGVALPQHQLS